VINFGQWIAEGARLSRSKPDVIEAYLGKDLILLEVKRSTPIMAVFML
jgi:hypothetical protein